MPIDTVMREDLDEFVTRLGSSKGPATFMEEDSDEDNVRFSFDYIEEFKAPDSIKKVSSWPRTNVASRKTLGVPKNH